MPMFGTALTQWIGSPLVNLDFHQQRFEADFRFNLVRVRENSEQIALLQGEQRRTRAAVGAFRPRRRQLVRHHEPNQTADGIHRELFTGRRAVSLHSGRARLFRQQDPARRADADRRSLRQACRMRSPSSYRSTAPWRNGAPSSRVSTDLRRAIASAERAADRCRLRSASCISRRAARSACSSFWSSCPTARRWSRPTTSAFAPASGRWSPARPAPASRRCSAPSPASGRSAPARSRSRQMPR